MIKLVQKQALNQKTEEVLKGYQQEIDELPAYADKVEKAGSMWRSRKRNESFDDVKARLKEMSPGIDRCAYCEDSAADEIEHIYPKDWFPERCFVWENYCYACGPCNGHKTNDFAVFEPGATAYTPLRREKQDNDTEAPKVPPPPGDAVLIDPRKEDPLDFLLLNFLTFEFEELADEGTLEYKRAAYTLELLRLNARDNLVKQRKKAFGGFRARLHEYVTAKENGTEGVVLDGMVREVQEESHITVWKEIKRQYNRHKLPALQDFVPLFEKAPEALEW